MFAMQRLHVRNIFKVVIPVPAFHKSAIICSTDDTSTFGFNLNQQTDGLQYSYRIRLYSDERLWHGLKRNQEVEFTQLLQWAKKNTISFQTSFLDQSVVLLILQLRIGPGFDFRKVPKRFVRFEVECFLLGEQQLSGTSQACQLLGKRRHANPVDADEVSIQIKWRGQEGEALNKAFADLACLDVLNNNGFNNTNCNNEDYSILDSGGSSEMISPEIEDLNTIRFLTNMEHDVTSSILDAHDTIALSPLSYENGSYIVLHNGNAEVVGNFRALNFYKASDINIKEDIRLLNEDRDCRGVILQIDGVAYKFKDHVSHTTNKRFVGYIAQQIEHFVPEAVQLIDGILHVDYESLIPYLSESIKQNFRDIQSNRVETNQIHQVVDMLYNEFIDMRKKHNNNEKSNDSKAADSRSSSKKIRPVYKWMIIVSLMTLIAVGGLVTYFVWPLISVHTDLQKDTKPLAPIIPVPDFILYEKKFLLDLYNATNGIYWKLQTGWHEDENFCNWIGIHCSHNNRILGINLSFNNLTGTLPKTFDYATLIEDINLSHNNLYGTLPNNFIFLEQLATLNMNNNQLTGTIPAHFINTKASFVLDLSNNKLNGTIPAQLMSNPILSELTLSSNQLTGTIPNMGDDWYSHTRAIYSIINLSSNQLEGPFPKLNLTPHASLNLSNNRLNGTVYFNKVNTQIAYFNIANNSFSGEFMFWPSADGAMDLNISNNNFTSVTSAIFITHPTCNASGNDFQCPIPSWLERNCHGICT